MSEAGFDPEDVERVGNGDYDYVYAEDYDSLLALYRSRDEWIDVKERLPQNCIGDEGELKYVLIYAPRHPDQILGSYRHDRWTFLGSNSDFSDRVTHWMPLPAPPIAAEGESR